MNNKLKIIKPTCIWKQTIIEKIQWYATQSSSTNSLNNLETLFPAFK